MPGFALHDTAPDTPRCFAGVATIASIKQHAMCNVAEKWLYLAGFRESAQSGGGRDFVTAA
ncbi:MAG: hypothetical protein IT462_00410 [Planctomycetes bacterium]|nr:hypothetical protein [Planctomycetota bacterium]